MAGTKRKAKPSGRASGVRDRVKDLRRVRAGDLVPSPDNWRVHPDGQREALRGVLEEVGYADALLVRELPDGRLGTIDGHLRADLDPEQIVPVLVLDVDENEAKKILLTHDPLAGMAEANAAALDALLREVETGSEAVAAMLAELAEGAGIVPPEAEPVDAEPQIDRAAELQAEWGTASGQLWEIPSKMMAGKCHRVLCGDACRVDDRALLFGDIVVESAVYDPPWDKSLIVPLPRNRLVFGDGSTIGSAVALFGSPTWIFVWDCVTSWYTPNRPLRRMKTCLWYGELDSYEENGAHYGEAGKPKRVTNTRGSYWYQGDSRGKHLSDIFSEPITKLHSSGPHPHEKPIDWVRMLIGNCLSGSVYDPFLGSFTTIVACENLARIGYGLEIDPGYMAVGLERLKQIGLTPRLAPASAPSAAGGEK